jgi:hypothetical protein
VNAWGGPILAIQPLGLRLPRYGDDQYMLRVRRPTSEGIKDNTASARGREQVEKRYS